jgi:hypothetical protein
MLEQSRDQPLTSGCRRGRVGILSYMQGTTESIPENAVWIADSGVFIACGRQQRNKYTALERFAQRNDITFVIPQRVYEELGGAPDRSTPGQTPINSASQLPHPTSLTLTGSLVEGGACP